MASYNFRKMLFRLVCVALLLCGALDGSVAYFITVDAHAEECFFERVEIGTKMGKFVCYFVTITGNYEA